MRLGFVVPLLATALLLGCTANNNGSTSSSSNAPVAKATAAPPGLGQVVKVGDLDLTVMAVRPIDTKQFNQFNAADTAVDITITDSRGANYDFNADLGMKLVDQNGVAHDPELGCASCPNALSDVKLVKDGHASGSVYYKLAGAVPTAVNYQAFGSTNKTTISVVQ